jgi:hypothetical protein
MAQADISGRTLIDAQFVHAQTSVDDRSPLFPVAFPTFISSNCRYSCKAQPTYPG